MADVFNTSYRTKADINTEEERLYYNIEEGAYVTTAAGVWTVWNGEWVKLYPQSGAGSGIGWARYDDGQFTSESKLTLADGVGIVIPNNAASVYRSYTGVDYYDSSTLKVLADNENDTYLMTLVFKYQAPNANQTYLEINFEGGNGTPYDRIRDTITFPKGNDVAHDYHQVFQYYADANFVNSGSQWNITSVGGASQIWDIIFFIQKVQSYA